MKKKIILILFIILGITSTIAWGLLNYGYSNGVRSGKLVKLSRKGFLFKTYEGTLDLGSGDKLTWDFSVHDEEIGEDLVTHTGQMVSLEYEEILHRIIYRTKYNVLSFKRIRPEGADKGYFCRLVNLLRKKRTVVEAVKPLIEQFDPSLMVDIKECQNSAL
jgi:hypothetical protein